MSKATSAPALSDAVFFAPPDDSGQRDSAADEPGAQPRMNWTHPGPQTGYLFWVVSGQSGAGLGVGERVRIS